LLFTALGGPARAGIAGAESDKSVYVYYAQHALYDAAVQLERAVAALTYVANECLDDAEKHCASVPVGEGRIIECLKKNESKLDARCKSALKDVGL
jgi:hypothetical protein